MTDSKTELTTIRVNNAATFRKFLICVQPLNSQAPIQVTEDGLKCVQLDPATIALVKATIKKEAATIEGSKELISIPITRTLDALSHVPPDASVEIRCKTTDSYEEVSVYADTGGWHRRVTYQSLGQPNKHEIPALEYSSSTEVDVEWFQRELKLMKRLHYKSTIISSHRPDNYLILSQDYADDTESYMSCYKDNEVATDENAAARYSVDYLLQFLGQKGSLSVSKSPVLYWKTDHPLLLSFSGDDVSVDYVLAPRIEN